MFTLKAIQAVTSGPFQTEKKKLTSCSYRFIHGFEKNTSDHCLFMFRPDVSSFKTVQTDQIS